MRQRSTTRRSIALLSWLVIEMASASRPAAAEPPAAAAALENYFSHLGTTVRNNAPVEMNITASLIKLHKTATLRTLRVITGMGRSVFETIESQGDATVRREVIARYLDSEAKAQESANHDLAISPANYKFSFKTETDYSGELAYVYSVKPRHKRVGLFEGEIWLDARTGSVLREWGEFVKSPSWFITNVYFVRDYAMRGGQAESPVPRRLILNVKTRMFGRADVTIWFRKAPTSASEAARASPEGTAAGPKDVGSFATTTGELQ